MQKSPSISGYVRKELIIATITAISVILSISLYLVTFAPSEVALIYIFDLGVTAILIWDFIHRLRESSDKSKFILHHFYEIPALLPLLFFGVLEYDATIMALFRAIKFIRIFRLMRLLRLINLFKAAKYLKASGFIYLVILLAVSIIFGAIGMLVVEEGYPDSTIKNFGDALWFAMTTITISGFGDVVPISVEGRIISSLLIIVGLTTILGFISSFGTTVVQKRLSKKRIAYDIKDSIKNRIDVLESIHKPEVDNLIEEIRQLHVRIFNQNIGCVKCGFIYPEIRLLQQVRLQNRIVQSYLNMS